jgi:hypothetical protein
MGVSPSFMAEAFRSVLTSILFIGENGTSPRMLVFTSAASGDGKTTGVFPLKSYFLISLIRVHPCSSVANKVWLYSQSSQVWQTRDGHGWMEVLPCAGRRQR